MDSRTRSASPAALIYVKHKQSPPVQDKISAYYSLVFPHFTFYIQTLSVTIGRRCVPSSNTATTSTTTEQSVVDVDLGALKSVSRLHAKIEYDQDEDRFVLVVVGRNGAWVDGIWCGSGTRAPLGERSQIQIASRTFHFILPPPPPPEDTPSPSSQSSTNRPRSPSVDITSISPPSSQPSHSPPPPAERKLPAPPPEPQIAFFPSPQPKSLIVPPLQPQLPNSNSIGKSNKAATSKKRKKSEVEATALPKPRPEDMPPKPPLTYAQLIYRAIKATGEKATLQEICSWIMNTYEYYRYTDASWMSSVRHNLSSSRAFLKLERCGGDRGKGFFWKLDEKHSQALEEHEARSSKSGPGGLRDGHEGNKKRKKDRALSMLEPPLKRSVKGDLKGMPLPPPLTSTPLPMKFPPSTTTLTGPSTSTTAFPMSSTKDTVTDVATAATGVFAYPTYPHHAAIGMTRQTSIVTSGYSSPSLGTPNPYAAWTLHSVSAVDRAPTTVTTTPTNATLPLPVSPILPTPPNSSFRPQPAPPQSHQPLAPVVPDVSLPIVLGSIPPTHPDYSPSHPHNSAKEGYMILHERTLILDPDVFGGLTKETLEGLEKMGTMAALQVLKDHMVKALKARRAEGRTRERSSKKIRGTGKQSGDVGTDTSGAPFTNLPPERKVAAGDKDHMDTSPSARNVRRVGGDAPAVLPLVPIPLAPMDVSESGQVDVGSPIVIIDDSDLESPLAKRRKVDDIPC